MATDLEVRDETTLSDIEDEILHHHLSGPDREMYEITRFSGPWLGLCGKYVTPLDNPYNHPCCPECAKRLSKPCRKSS